MNNEEIVIIYKETGKPAKFQKIKNDIYEFEKLVGKNFDIIPYIDIVIVCKKDRKNLKPNIYIQKDFLNIGETIRGDIIITCKENDKFNSLTKQQTMKYINFLENASFHYDNLDENGNIIFSKNKYYLKKSNKELDLDYPKDFNNNNSKSLNDEVLKTILQIQQLLLKLLNNTD